MLRAEGNIFCIHKHCGDALLKDQLIKSKRFYLLPKGNRKLVLLLDCNLCVEKRVICMLKWSARSYFSKRCRFTVLTILLWWVLKYVDNAFTTKCFNLYNNIAPTTNSKIPDAYEYAFPIACRMKKKTA